MNIAFADGGNLAEGNAVIFQFRNTQRRAQIGFDVGVVDRPEVGDASVVAGVGIGRALSAASDPLSLLLTVGGYTTLGDPWNVYRIPAGVSIGAQIPLEGSLLLTPYAHPRVSVDICDACSPPVGRLADDRDDVDINGYVELGLDLAFTPALSIRLAAVVGSDSFMLGDGDVFGVSLAYRPSIGRRTGGGR